MPAGCEGERNRPPTGRKDGQMATRKTEEVKPAAEEVEAAEEIKKPASSWDIMKSVRVPRKAKNDYYYVCVNDRRYEIPANGKTQEMPLPIAEALEQSIEAEYRAEDYANNIPNRG